MVRFIIIAITTSNSTFIFIYIPLWLDLLFICSFLFSIKSLIYIPLWLDLLFDKKTTTFIFPNDLHSTMVRFIIVAKLKSLTINEDLHSTMVRFIILLTSLINLVDKLFTFHYG